MVRIIAQANIYATSLELVFKEPPEGITKLNLKNALSGGGFSVKERRPDGVTVIWECYLPLGDSVTEDTIRVAKHAVETSGIKQQVL